MKRIDKYRVYSRFLAFFLCTVPLYGLYIFAACIVAAVFILPDKESLNLLNYTFPVVGVFAGISFSWAQCLPQGPHQAMVLRASTRFFCALILLCLGIMVTFIANTGIPGIELPRPALLAARILVFYAVTVALVFFCAGLHATARNLRGTSVRKPDADPVSHKESTSEITLP